MKSAAHRERTEQREKHRRLTLGGPPTMKRRTELPRPKVSWVPGAELSAADGRQSAPGLGSLLLPLLLLLLLLLLLPACRKAPPPPPPPAVPVTAAEVLVRDQPVYLEYIGQTLGAQDVEIRARVEGFLESVDFAEGTFVKKGVLLYTIDGRPFQAALARAAGEEAQRRAAWEKANRDVERFGPLWEKNAISRQQYDDALAAREGAAANLEAAKADVDSARIELGYTRIYSPLDGIAGKTEVKAGNLVGRGQSTLLTTISSVDPIHVRFSISEQDYLAWRRQSTPAERPREEQDIFELILSDGTVHPRRGRAVFADRQVDPTTGTFMLEVAFANPDNILRPGQFGRVRFALQTIAQAVLVPQRAVQELQANYSVFVVSEDNQAEIRKVTLGPRAGNFFVVEAGLQAGEKIVVEGSQKLQNHTPVAVTLTDLASEATGPPTP